MCGDAISASSVSRYYIQFISLVGIFVLLDVQKCSMPLYHLNVTCNCVRQSVSTDYLIYSCNTEFTRITFKDNVQFHSFLTSSARNKGIGNNKLELKLFKM